MSAEVRYSPVDSHTVHSVIDTSSSHVCCSALFKTDQKESTRTRPLTLQLRVTRRFVERVLPLGRWREAQKRVVNFIRSRDLNSEQVVFGETNEKDRRRKKNATTKGKEGRRGLIRRRIAHTLFHR